MSYLPEVRDALHAAAAGQTARSADPRRPHRWPARLSALAAVAAVMASVAVGGFLIANLHVAGSGGARHGGSVGTESPASGSCSPSVRKACLLRVLHPSGIASLRFGASLRTVRARIRSLLHEAGGRYRRGGSCDVDHYMNWPDRWTASGQPELIIYFRRARFAGYQFGGIPGPGGVHTPSAGWSLSTNRGLRIGDTLARGRRLYGHAFTLSAAQGGVWQLRSRPGELDGYAWRTPKHGDVSWHSLVATIDAGAVGCPAVSP